MEGGRAGFAVADRGHPVAVLLINAGTVLSKPKILDHVWRYDFGGDVNVVES